MLDFVAVEQITALYLDGSQFAPDVPRNVRKPLSLQKGTQLVLDINVVTPAGRPVDLSTVVPIVFSVRKNPEPASAPTLISRVAIIPAGAPRGRTRITIVPSDTVNLQPGIFVWNLLGKFPLDVWETLVGLGPLHIEPTA